MGLIASLDKGVVELAERALYVKAYFQARKEICAIAPTCWKVINNVRDKIPQKTKTVIELGSGTGRLVDVLLDLPDLEQIISLEPQKDFRNFQVQRIDDARVDILDERAENLVEVVHDLVGSGKKVDVVCASLPFSIMKNADEIYRQIASVLEPDGKFITYIFRDVRSEQRKVFDQVDMEKVCGPRIPWPWGLHKWAPFQTYNVHTAMMAQTAPLRTNDAIDADKKVTILEGSA